MSVQIVVDVPDRLYHHLVRLAKSSGSERDELSVLVYIYEQGSILKAKALHEAIRRGLHQPVNA